MTLSRLCLIGNSHLACMKLAGDRERDLLPARSIDYFAGPANSMDKIQLVDRYFLASDDYRLKKQMTSVSFGKDRIDIRDYDAFVIVGLAFEFRDFFRLFRTNCLFSDLKWRARRDLISDGYFSEYLTDLFRTRPGNRIARRIKAIGDVPVIFAPSPYPSETILEEKVNRHLQELRRTRYFEELAAFYTRCATAAAEAAGAGIAFQGAESIAAPAFTKERFNRRPVGLVMASRRADVSEWHAEKSRYDPWHMNVDFGRLRLRDIAAALRLAPRREAEARLNDALSG